MNLYCPVCQVKLIVNPIDSRDETYCRCSNCGLYAVVNLKKDKHGRVWKLTLTEKTKGVCISGSSELKFVLFIVWIVIILLVFYLYSQYYR